MKMLEFDQKKGVMRLVIENLDDLWHLYNLISKNDIVQARTSREIKAEGDSARPGAGRRVSMILEVKTTDVFFDKDTGRLRVRGTIINAPDRYDGLLGAYHTMSLTPDMPVTLVKGQWASHDIRRVSDACETRTPAVVITALDDEEACVAVLGRFGYEVKFEKRQKLPGKREVDKRKDAARKYFAEVAQALDQTHNVVRGQIVIIGPGFVKNEFSNFLRSEFPDMAAKIGYLGHGSFGGQAGVSEALRSGALTKVIAKSRVIEEMNLVENLFAELGTDSKKVAYGIDEVQKAAEYGAVETLIVVDKLLRESNDMERLKVENIMRTVEKSRGRLAIISGEHEGGEKIFSLGGLAAKLRFPV